MSKTTRTGPHRRHLLALAGASTPLLSAQAQDAAAGYPSRPVRIIIPWPPGSLTDMSTRLVADRLQAEFGQPFVIDYKPGGNGMIGMEAAARSPADGYTLGLGTAETISINPFLFRNVPYDAPRDFVPVASLAVQPLVLLANPGFAANDIATLIARAKAQPGALRFGSWGEGSSAHLAMEMLKAAAGIDVLHVVYRGSPQVVSDLVSGTLDIAFAGQWAMQELVPSGRVKALAVTAPQRVPLAPNLPTIAESFPGYAVSLWYGLMAPAGTPAAIVQKLNAGVQRALAVPEVQQRLQGAGGSAMPLGIPEFTAFLQAETVRWQQAVRASGVQISN